MFMYIDFAVVDPLIAGAAIAGVGSLLGGLFGHKSTKSANATNLQAVRETNQANMDLNRYNWAKTYQMWHDTNEYNTPLNQRQRFMQAGINPYFALNSMNAGNAGASSSPSMIPMQAGHVEPYNYDFVSQSTQNALQAYFQGKSVQSTAKMQDAQAKRQMKKLRLLLFKIVLINISLSMRMSLVFGNIEDLNMRLIRLRMILIIPLGLYA